MNDGVHVNYVDIFMLIISQLSAGRYLFYSMPISEIVTDLWAYLDLCGDRDKLLRLSRLPSKPRRRMGLDERERERLPRLFFWWRFWKVCAEVEAKDLTFLLVSLKRATVGESIGEWQKRNICKNVCLCLATAANCNCGCQLTKYTKSYSMLL